MDFHSQSHPSFESKLLADVHEPNYTQDIAPRVLRDRRMADL